MSHVIAVELRLYCNPICESESTHVRINQKTKCSNFATICVVGDVK